MTTTFARALLATAALLTAPLVGAATPAEAVAAPAAPAPAAPVATPGALLDCETLASFTFDGTVIDSAELAAAGSSSYGGAPIDEHCIVRGRMHERVSDIDGQSYAIGFEVRLPAEWSGRFLHQGNGGLDGNVTPALGAIGSAPESALQRGFAVLSSDAGHSPTQNPLFGLDPQARLDYGYQAAASLTPMTKALIAQAYGRGPDVSYFAGGSNGGRHTMVAAARLVDEYDGFFANAPGFNLPRTAVGQVWIAQQLARIATDPADLSTAFSAEQRRLVADAILERCDAIDGLADGIVADTAACQAAFELHRDVPACASDDDRGPTCLTAAQQDVLAELFAGATTSDGTPVYAPWPYDPGIATVDWGRWVLQLSSSLGAMAAGFVFTTPPQDASILADLQGYALGADVDALAAGITATSGVYGESAMSFMTPPDVETLAALRAAGGKLLVVHGVADGAFSTLDAARWYDALDAANGGAADEFVRYFEVPGMTHVRGGPATDEIDGLAAIVAWVEQGVAPDRLIATARGAGNALGTNPDVPADWSADRSRPLCPYPLVAVYAGGDPEAADSFACATSAATPTATPTPTAEPTTPGTTSPDATEPTATAPAPTEPAAAAPAATAPPRPGDALATTGEGNGPAHPGVIAAVLVAAGAALVVRAARRRREEARRE